MTQTHCYTTYAFEELTPEAQETAIETCHEINVDDDYWHESTIDDAKTIGALIGIEIDNIYFSGFWSQGDGACFEGSYEYKKGGLKAIKEYAPRDAELHRIAKGLQDLQRVNFYKLSATVRQSGHYYHENCTEINTEKDYECIDQDTSDELAELLRDLMKWIYRALESDYEFQTGEAQILDTILANEYEFNKDGTFNRC